MASFTGVGDNVTLTVPNKGEQIDIDISGTYNMTILFQREQGSPGSDSWETVTTYTTANATVADKYTTKNFNEKLRLYVSVDTSGTATATLTDNDNRQHLIYKDQVGNTLFELTDGGVVIPQGLRRSTDSVVSVTDATVTLTAADHAGRVVVLNRAAGVTATMPAATGTGDVYTVFVGTTVTSNNDIVQAASSADVFQGGILIATDTGGITVPTSATTDTITMNGSTTGGVLGSYVKLTDVASGVFQVEGFLVSTGAEATPFSAAV